MESYYEGATGVTAVSRSLPATAWHHRGLIYELARREFTGRYRGSFGGVAWSFVQPLFLLSVYTLAFGVILQMRWNVEGSTGEYALLLFAGLIVFNMFSECLGKSTSLITGNPNYVKKVVFPLELLPIVSALTALTHTLLAIGVWLIGYIMLVGLPHVTFLLFPLILITFLPILLGVGWLFSSIGAIVRDIGQLTGLLSHALLFLTPIFYSIEVAPATIRDLLVANPLTFIVEQLRQVAFYGELPDFQGLMIYFMAASVFAALMLRLFKKLRPIFADLV